MNKLDIRDNVRLAPMTTLGIGGITRYFVRAGTEAEIIDAVRFAADRCIGLFVLGGGSNVLIDDAGFDGLTVQIGLEGVEIEDGVRSAPRTVVIAQAGEDWDTLVAECVRNDLAGLECMSGIPGLVGGTPIQNVGAYGQEVADTIVSVRCLDLNSMKIVELAHGQCGFAYRTSIFNTILKERYIVLSVTFALERGGSPLVTYKDLAGIFGERSPSLSEVRDAVLTIRRSKSMVIDPLDPNSRSAGSFFKNPVVPRSRLGELRSDHPDIPHFAFGKDSVKIPAAWLIEHAGFHKGFSVGNAGISANHTLALINRGDASSAELVELMRLIQQGVNEKFGIELRPEPVFVGFS